MPLKPTLTQQKVYKDNLSVLKAHSQLQHCWMEPVTLNLTVDAAFLHHAKLLQDGLLKNKASKAAMEANFTALAANQLLSIVEKEKDNSEDAVYSQALESELVGLRKGNFALTKPFHIVLTGLMLFSLISRPSPRRNTPSSKSSSPIWLLQ